ncbi:mannitol dehydrogenase family protein [Pseudactinotalea sp. HY158]|uniref:mannitol dehydrogenase family protein n=1 Tax=Pseudactinotalea sp. HY158 TaxID=2654547 RepID=UPI00129C8F3B|nr:mannitol dehydrogenase family protein [Pseudactinotalea sp. HY158]QGH69495.1 mannitol dehydrogenase family protein [Pseudactinotalea sp. HY158]
MKRLARDVSHEPAPVRIVHLGLGNFFRAHQAWYTGRAPDASEWGIAAFTGRRPDGARVLAPQDGLYTLITRGPAEDSFEVVDSVSAVHTASDHAALLDYFRDPEVALVTMTVTEAGYLHRGGALVLDDEQVVADLAALRADPYRAVVTVPGKLVAGLLARQVAGAGPITLLPCDNLPGNGEVVERVVRDFAAAADGDLLEWIDEHVDFASSMVDRITPAASAEDERTVREHLGMEDASPVRTEPFSEWVMSGAFPAGRPRWEDAGASIVADVVPYEQRKLLLLNGSHSLLAYSGPLLGHETVDEAIADPRCRAWVNELWDDATATVPLPVAEVAAYRSALLERFDNPRMGDALARIAMDGSQKIPVRIVPVVRTERGAGRMPTGAARALAAWIAHLRGHGTPVTDVEGASWQESAAGEAGAAVTAVLERLGIGGDADLEELVGRYLAEFEQNRRA